MKLVANASTPAPALWVACLCADWCGSCRDYRERFEQIGSAFPGAQFLWVDIEDHADLIDPIEVDNFPTVLVVVDGMVRFFGSITPHIETLQRLVQAQLEAPPAAAVSNPDVASLVSRLRG